ncbi:hypothetical protein MTR62_14940 [Novosphingobium sp. 1949]|uniref:Porin n=1 Tax=Novosphingobium organovorum TaxID=2930092 RepID=A0ABT0BFY2_9SPHN|nr:hypothetical protein [Novosphingobium organovorum]MCJ2183981.1 hypothetical protein [Novosphingobium organovorum]
MKTALMLGGLLGTLALGSTPVLAQDSSTDTTTTTAKIEALEQQIAQLKQSVDALKAASAAASTPAVSSDTVTTTATASPAAAAPVASAPASSGDSALPAWLADTTISGKGYLNLSTIHQLSDGAKTATNGTQAELKRFYISVDHRFSDIFSADLTTDVRYGSNGLTNDDSVYVKKAYLQAKFAPELWVRLGAADLPWVPFVEGIYNYRFVENTLIDRTKYGTSADWGVHVGGTLGHGLVGYQVSAVSGEGYKTLERKTDTVDLEGRLDVHPVKGLTLAVGGYEGKLGKSNATLAESATPYRAKRFDALAAYVQGPLRVGVEYFSAWDWAVTAKDQTTGWSAFGSYALNRKIALFGRYDWVDPTKDSVPQAKENYYDFGVDYTGVKNIDIALVYKRDEADNISMSTSNGTIGGTDEGTYDELGVWTQFKF